MASVAMTPMAGSRRVPAAATAARARVDDAADRQLREFRRNRRQRQRGRGVAGDDDVLGLHGFKKRHDSPNEPADRLRRFIPVREMCGIPEINQVLGRQRPPQGIHDGQSPQPAVEDRDGIR